MKKDEGPVRLLILSIAAQYLLPLLFLLSLFELLRGHNEPGGGFVGGLIAATALVLYAQSHGIGRARQVLRADPLVLIGVGLLAALSAGLIPLVLGLPFMTGLWAGMSIPVVGKAGTPLLFDIGVYLTVVGITVLIIFSLMEE
jgi:multicomponent Na+:H+ antiporter subunit B